MPHPPELYVGLMSGTSLDGIDAALVDFGKPDGYGKNAAPEDETRHAPPPLSNPLMEQLAVPPGPQQTAARRLASPQAGERANESLCEFHIRPVQLAKHYVPFDDGLKSALLALHQPGHNELHQAQLIGNQLARLYAAAVNALLATANLSNADIRALGCHGQTIRHCPEHGYTLQIGNAALLAELTGITVVSDFRSGDIAAGGHGAPLVPAFHDKVMRHPGIHRVIVNIGGISNLTNLPPNAATSGFDCGPGNLLMDAWCMQHMGKSYDENGAWAASGKVLPALLEEMLSEPFFALPPPRSSGRDLFNMSWLSCKLKGSEASEDVQATLLELTCRTIAQPIRQYCSGSKEIYLCGGGAHNQTLHERLAALLPDCSVRTTDALGVDGDYLEATAFAWLAKQALHGKPANLPLVTGARHPCILGAVYRHS